MKENLENLAKKLKEANRKLEINKKYVEIE